MPNFTENVMAKKIQIPVMFIVGNNQSINWLRTKGTQALIWSQLCHGIHKHIHNGDIDIFCAIWDHYRY